MLSEELKEKQRKWLLEIQNEFERTAREHPVLSPMAEEHFAQAFSLLQREDRSYLDVWSHVWSHLYGAYKTRFYFDASPHSNRLPTLQEIQYADILLDLGIFAFRLAGSFFYLHDVVECIWEKRKDFQPHLSSVLHATYQYRCLIQAGHKPEDALERALRVRDELYEMFGHEYKYRDYFPRDISMLLSPEVLTKLQQLLLNLPSNRPDPAK